MAPACRWLEGACRVGCRAPTRVKRSKNRHARAAAAAYIAGSISLEGDRVTAIGFAVFDTALGACGIAWGERGVVGVQLPAADARATRARLRRRFPDAGATAPPADVQRAIDGIVALMRGERRHLSAV